MNETRNGFEPLNELEDLAALRVEDLARERTERLHAALQVTFSHAHRRARSPRWVELAMATRRILEPAFLATVSASYLLWALSAVSSFLGGE